MTKQKIRCGKMSLEAIDVVEASRVKSGSPHLVDDTSPASSLMAVLVCSLVLALVLQRILELLRIV